MTAHQEPVQQAAHHPPKHNVHLNFSKMDCVNDRRSSHNGYAHISCYEANIGHPDCPNVSVGSIICQLLHKSRMDALGLGAMWEQCQAYGASHGSNSKLDKVENYLANECFEPEKQVLIDQAAYILFVEEVVIVPTFRGQGLSLLAVELLNRELQVGEHCVVLLQAAPLVKGIEMRGEEVSSAVEAHEKLARHWKRMGFEEWSWTDDAWLCLSTALGHRPKIEDVLSEVSFGHHSQ